LSILTGEQVPSAFITTLRSNGYEVVQARTVFGEATNDQRLPEYCGEHRHVLVAHDRMDFAGRSPTRSNTRKS
jgi:predicted nuclease of predicted toxin-antitoxin system